MKPFNLERALAGEPVITRNGKKVTELYLFKNAKIIQPLYGTIEDDEDVFSWTTNGIYNPTKNTSFDLFMAPESKFLWINLWQQLHENGNYYTTVHTREDLADLEIENNVTLKHIQKLTMIL
jgi:hypothetical protein